MAADTYPIYGPGLQEAALKLLMLEEDTEHYQHARKKIRTIAFHYFQLKNLAKAADKFIAALHALGFDTIGDMSSAGNWYRNGESYTALKKHDDSGNDITVGLIVGILKDMAANAKTAATNVAKPKGGRSPEVASTIFVVSCLHVFETYRPGVAASTGDGDFRQFVSFIYEMATGEEKDFEHHVKTVLRTYRMLLDKTTT